MGLMGRHDPAMWPQPKDLVTDILLRGTGGCGLVLRRVFASPCVLLMPVQ